MILEPDLFDLKAISEVGYSTVGVYACTQEGKYYWGVTTEYEGIEGEEIPQYLYEALTKYGIEKEEQHRKKYLAYLESKNKHERKTTPKSSTQTS